MAFKFWLYEIGCLDFCHGMTRLFDYIKLCDEKMMCCVYPNHIELKKFLIICFMEIKTSIILWDGDIRHDEIYISAIPGVHSASTKKLIAFKQDNGGTSFCVSESKLEIDNNGSRLNSVFSLKDFDKRELLRFFHESHDLVEELFSKAMTVKPVIENNKHEIFSFDVKKAVEKIKQESITEINENKFDKSNYVQL